MNNPTYIVIIQFTEELGDLIPTGPFDTLEDAKAERDRLRAEYDAAISVNVVPLLAPKKMYAD
jgi:hypothetical protein